MKKQLNISLKMLGVMTLLLGIVYPLFITGFAQLVFPAKANGSLVSINGTLRGSQWIGQSMNDSLYFHPRPSASAYNALSSGGSNLGLTSRKLHEYAETRKTAFIENNRLAKDTKVPSEMLFASASGLDPHISPEAARMQIDRIASARNFPPEKKRRLSDLVDNLTEEPQFGILGCARINVFMLNLELDKLQ